MTDEEINRKFDVVAGHMAGLAVGLQQLQDVQRHAEERWERTEGSIRALLTITEIQSQEIRDLGEAVRAVDQRQREADDRARQAGERLNTLINTVERFISRGRGGQGGG